MDLNWTYLDLLPEPFCATWVTMDQLPCLSGPRFPWILDLGGAYIFTM